MIKLKNVSKSYRAGAETRVILDDVSVEFPTGVSVGILGLNGSGKSTLLRIIGGVEASDHGTIEKDIRASWPIGFTGAIHQLMTGRENARFVARIYGKSPHKIAEFAEKFTELGTYFDLPLKTYSSGMKARLAFAVSMAAEFDCYLVDEVISVGDIRFNLKYRRAFRERAKGASVILASHNPQTIKDECEIAGVLHDGKFRLYDTVDIALTEYRNIALYSEDYR